MSGTEQPAQSEPVRTVRVLMRGNACISCRRRKQRCDGTRPVCQQCIRFNRVSECVFEERPRTQAEMLEDRVRELEALIAQAQAPPNTANAPNAREGELPRPDIALVSSPSLTAEPAGDPPAEITDHLIQVFFRHLYQFNFGLDIAKFRLSLSLPPSDPMAPHPALLNAIYAVGCYFASTTPTNVRNIERFESIFLHRAQRHLDDALAHVDRLLDFLTATHLLAQYNLMKGNVSKGSYLASSAMSFGVGCGMHRITLNPTFNQYEATILPPPANIAEMMERINVFSGVFQIERRAVIESGAPTAILDQDIITPWPRLAPAAGVAGGNNTDEPTVNSLYQLDASATSMQNDIPLAVRAKTMALFDRATRLARQASFVFRRPLDAASDTLFWDSYHALDYALVNFRASLPPVSSTYLPTLNLNARALNPAVAYDAEERAHTLVFAHIASLTAVMHVHDIFAPRDESERGIVLGAAREVARVVREAVAHPGVGIDGVLDPRKTHMLVGDGIALAARTLLRERDRPRASTSASASASASLAVSTPSTSGAGASETTQTQSLTQQALAADAAFLITCLRALTSFYPGLQVHLAEVEVIG